MRCLAVVLAFGVMALGADPSAHFAGTWRVNVQKSDFGPLFAPKSAQVSIEQGDGALTVTDKETNEQGEQTNAQSKFMTDGKQSTGTIIAFPMQVTGTAKWDGEAFRFTGSGQFNGMDVHVDEKWQPGPENASFKITRTLSATMGTTTQTVVLEK